jgi:hypothetical protein
MQSVIVDKIGSVALDAELGREIRVDSNIPAEEGVLIAVEVLNNKSRYNTLELTSGRMAEVKRGDIIVGALGHRKALFGYSGHLPEHVAPGDVLQILNLGGVIGVCDSVNPTQGNPFDCRVIGVVLDFPYLALRRDILAMEDAGARNTGIFTDFGVVTTTKKNAPALTRELLNMAAEQTPDVIVFELGDGILGTYGVEAILEDEGIRDALSAVVLCANDPVGAWGGIKLLREHFGIEPTVVTGPATDNQVGIDIILERCNTPAVNAMTNAADLGDLLHQTLGLAPPLAQAAS